MNNQPTPGALRAVNAYCDKHPGLPASYQSELALIIDRESGYPEVVKALRDLLNWGRDHLSVNDPGNVHEMLVAAHHAIAKAEDNQ